MSSQLHAGPDPDPEEGPQIGERTDRPPQSLCPNHGRHGSYPHAYRDNRHHHPSTACRSRSPHLPELQQGPNFYRPPRLQMDRRPSRCFLCGEEGHFVSNCPARPVLQCLLRQQARASSRAPPRGQILELPTNEDDSHPNSNVQLNC